MQNRVKRRYLGEGSERAVILEFIFQSLKLFISMQYHLLNKFKIIYLIDTYFLYPVVLVQVDRAWYQTFLRKNNSLKSLLNFHLL